MCDIYNLHEGGLALCILKFLVTHIYLLGVIGVGLELDASLS